MASCVSRMPAVSIKRKVIPCNTTVSSMTSRVVPCMSETMALSSLTRRLSSVDFPALVSPIMAVGTPFLMALPSVNESERRLMTRSISLARSVSFSRSANSTSSSLKSSSSSTSEANVSSFSRSRISSRLNPPRICCIAKRCEAAEVEAIRSATASACDRSSFPLVKALRVNSPGWASRQPARNRRLMICC